jgi:hypothetical protein
MYLRQVSASVLMVAGKCTCADAAGASSPPWPLPSGEASSVNGYSSTDCDALQIGFRFICAASIRVPR